MNDIPEIRRKRLLFQSWHRGTRETDLLLGSFAEKYLAQFSPAQLDSYEALLDESDADIFDWIVGRSEPPAAARSDVLDLLLDFRYGSRSA